MRVMEAVQAGFRYSKLENRIGERRKDAVKSHLSGKSGLKGIVAML